MTTANRVILIGYVTSEVEVKKNNVCTFSLATFEEFTDSQGEKKKIAEFHKIVSFGKLSLVVQNHFSKGKYLHIEGRLKYEKYEDKNGMPRITTSIRLERFTFLATPNREKREESQPDYNTNQTIGYSPVITSLDQTAFANMDFDDTIPF